MKFDSLVIGSGPTGLTAAMYLARFGLSVGLVERQSSGGLVLQTMELENYPGFATPIKGYELADAMDAQIAPYKNITRIAGVATEMDLSGFIKRVKIDDDWVETATIIIASGVIYKTLGLPNEEKFLGKGLSHCALCDGQFYRNKVVGVAGGGNSALEEATYLSTIASSVHLIHRRDAFRADKWNVDRISANEKVSLELSEIVTALHGDEFLDAVTIKNLVTNEERKIPMECLFVFVGFLPSTSYVSNDITTDKDGFIVTDMEMCTNISGVFAAGDVRAKLCRQVVTAVGDGATAANSAYLYLDQQHA